MINLAHIYNEISGDWAIDDINVEEDIIIERTNKYDTHIYPKSIYKVLKRSEYNIMSNTPGEISDLTPFVEKAYGNILINGLGLGVIITALLQKESVKSITVIENSSDVIALISKYYPTIKIIHEDAFKYQPTQYYDFIWHDIWDTISENNLSEMEILENKYKDFCGHQECWAKELCKYLNNK